MQFELNNDSITIEGSGNAATIALLVAALEGLGTPVTPASPASAPAPASEPKDSIYSDTFNEILDAYDGRPDATHKIVAFRQPVVGDKYLDPTGFTVKRKTTPREFGPRLIVEVVEQDNSSDDNDGF
jgi:hypothetical protein